MHSLLEAVDESQRVTGNTNPATELSPEDRRLLLGASLRLLIRRFSCGSPRFQTIFEHYYATRNGNPLSEAMERAIQRANKIGVKVPPQFFESKRTVERREAEELASPAESARPELEDLPWAKR